MLVRCIWLTSFALMQSNIRRAVTVIAILTGRRTYVGVVILVQHTVRVRRMYLSSFAFCISSRALDVVTTDHPDYSPAVVRFGLLVANSTAYRSDPCLLHDIRRVGDQEQCSSPGLDCLVARYSIGRSRMSGTRSNQGVSGRAKLRWRELPPPAPFVVRRLTDVLAETYASLG